MLRGVLNRATKERNLGSLVPLGVRKERQVMDRYDARRRTTMRHRVVRRVPEITLSRRATTPKQPRFADETRYAPTRHKCRARSVRRESRPAVNIIASRHQRGRDATFGQTSRELDNVAARTRDLVGDR